MVVILMISGGLILFRAKEGITFHSVGFLLVRRLASAQHHRKCPISALRLGRPPP